MHAANMNSFSKCGSSESWQLHWGKKTHTHTHAHILLYASMCMSAHTCKHTKQIHTGFCGGKKRKKHDSLHKQACWTPLGGGAVVRRNCSIIKHICSLITKAKVVGLAVERRVLCYDLRWARPPNIRMGSDGQNNITSLIKYNMPLNLHKLITGHDNKAQAHKPSLAPMAFTSGLLAEMSGFPGPNTVSVQLPVSNNCPAACLYYKVAFPAFHPNPSVKNSGSFLHLGRTRRKRDTVVCNSKK